MSAALSKLVCGYCGGLLMAMAEWGGPWHRLDCDRCGRMDLRAAEICLVKAPAAAREPGAGEEG